ncbi:MBL fold metallo-hydrolase [Paenibacillus sp. NPDC058071]|uniref:MBL fold metallo-hydrolase n=1 Tax=Paenibacillus sp. NPDC058071 TaxID=3346326 RepID=UPI0036DC80E3
MADGQTSTTIWNGNWIQVKVPLPFSLKWVNSYVLPEPDGEGFTVVDPGLRTEEAIGAWQEAMERHGLSMRDVKRIILTHQHPDHYGLAGYFQEQSGAPVYMTKRAHDYTIRLWGERADFSGDLHQLFEVHGMPRELLEAIDGNLDAFLERVSPQPVVTYIEAGSEMEFGGSIWQLIDAPGHAFGQVCFYDAQHGWMLCGDQVLPRITPNIGFVPGEEENPLEHFLTSLRELSRYEVKMAFPGHRDPFPEFEERIEALLQHHERRLTSMLGLLKQPLTAFELCEETFGKSLRSNPHNLRFAMQETLAHLHYLEQQGSVIRTVGAPVVFQAAGD